MPDLLLQIGFIVPNLLLFSFLGYYMVRVMNKEQELQKKSDKIDAGYHQIVDNALTKERKILEDATAEADEIIAGAQYISQESKNVVNEALQKMVADIQKEAVDTAQNYTASYEASLKQLTLQSLTDFQTVAKGLKEDLQKTITDFHEKLLPKLESELDEYKRIRLEQTDSMVKQIIQIVSQELLNKTISLEDHQKMVKESLEKAKKQGAFD